MTATKVRRTCYDDAHEAELDRWPGVKWRRECRSKHLAIVLDYNGQTRFFVYPGSPGGDEVRGALNSVSALRAVLKAMGANREAPAKSTAPRRKRAAVRAPIPTQVERTEGRHDPLAALVEVRKRIADQAPFVLPIRVKREPKRLRIFAQIAYLFKT